MKAVVQDRYGGPEALRIEEVPEPVPRQGEVKVRIAASAVTSGDARIRAFDVPPVFRLPARLMLGIAGPRQRIPGYVLAGTVEALGEGVTRFRAGERVMGMRAGGCHAEACCVPEAGAIAHLPEEIGFESGAALPFGGHTAMHFLRRAGLEAGQRLLVVGASGEVGAMAVQLGAVAGAEVAGVCSAGNADLVRSLGASRVFDYAAEDFRQADVTWDVILDTVGATRFEDCRRVLAPQGRHVFLVGSARAIWQAAATARSRGQRVIAGEAEERAEDIAALARLAAEGTIRPVVDGVYPLGEIGAAHARVDTRRKRGAVVLRIAA